MLDMSSSTTMVDVLAAYEAQKRTYEEAKQDLALLGSGYHIKGNFAIIGMDGVDLADGLVDGAVLIKDSKVTKVDTKAKSFNFAGSTLSSWPKNLTKVEGDLNLRGTTLKPGCELPPDLEVKGTLTTSYSNIKRIPDQLTIWNIDAANSPLAELPAHATILGSVNAANTPVSSVPFDFSCGGTFTATGTNIDYLPPGCRFGSLSIAGLGVSDLTGVTVDNDLNASKTKLKSLRDFSARGTIDLSGCTNLTTIERISAKHLNLKGTSVSLDGIQDLDISGSLTAPDGSVLSAQDLKALQSTDDLARAYLARDIESQGGKVSAKASFADLAAQAAKAFSDRNESNAGSVTSWTDIAAAAKGALNQASATRAALDSLDKPMESHNLSGMIIDQWPDIEVVNGDLNLSGASLPAGAPPIISVTGHANFSGTNLTGLQPGFSASSLDISSTSVSSIAGINFGDGLRADHCPKLTIDKPIKTIGLSLHGYQKPLPAGTSVIQLDLTDASPSTYHAGVTVTGALDLTGTTMTPDTLPPTIDCASITMPDGYTVTKDEYNRLAALDKDQDVKKLLQSSLEASNAKQPLGFLSNLASNFKSNRALAHELAIARGAERPFEGMFNYMEGASKSLDAYRAETDLSKTAQVTLSPDRGR